MRDDNVTLPWREDVAIKVDYSKRDDRHYKMSSEKLLASGLWLPQQRIEDAIDANFQFFADGGIDDPTRDIWYNNRRMAREMQL